MTIEISSPSPSAAERSRSSPPARTTRAALARPGPIASAASAPLAPPGDSRGVPSGSFTVIGASLPCYPRPRTRAEVTFRVIWTRKVKFGPSMAASRGPWRASRNGNRGQSLREKTSQTGPTRSPKQVGTGAASEAQAAVGRAAASGGGDHEADSPWGRRAEHSAVVGPDADAPSAQLPGEEGDAVLVLEEAGRRPMRRRWRRRGRVRRVGGQAHRGHWPTPALCRRRRQR